MINIDNGKIPSIKLLSEWKQILHKRCQTIIQGQEPNYLTSKLILIFIMQW